jgi:hypothetical protein
MSDEQDNPVSCPVPSEPDLSNLTLVELEPDERVADYRAAMRLANTEAEKRIGIHHGATLKGDIGQGRFVFFYLPVDLA